ncbi:MAG TPA: GNAT family protein [Smithellaceae bacterium]|nr:GNAT family protein [Smithellaceae bacterium]
MVISGKKVNLRPFQKNDARKTIAWRNASVIRFLAMMHPYPVTKEMEKEWLKGILHDTSNRCVTFAIETVAKHKLIGSFQLRDIQWIHRRAWLGIMIGDSEEQGKGFGSEAMRLGMDYAFKVLHLEKISLEVVRQNQRAINLYEKIGFKREGLLKRHYYFDGGYHDVLIMSLIKPTEYLGR